MPTRTEPMPNAIRITLAAIPAYVTSLLMVLPFLRLTLCDAIAPSTGHLFIRHDHATGSVVRHAAITEDSGRDRAVRRTARGGVGRGSGRARASARPRRSARLRAGRPGGRS